MIIFGCSDDIVDANHVSPDILQTDSVGNIIGGNSSDWCKDPSGHYIFGPAYPNPSTKKCIVEFEVPYDSYVKLSLSALPVSKILIDRMCTAGYYAISIDSDSLNLHGKMGSVTITSTGNNQSFSCSGNIQFN